MKTHSHLKIAIVSFSVIAFGFTYAASKPNIILLFSDDISARELPLYGSSVWTPPEGGDTSNPQYRAKTPVLDKLAKEGCWFRTAWASVVCSPSRAMMMTGRFAHLHKWWENGDYGRTMDAKTGKPRSWMLYESSPHSIGKVAQQGGYATYWAGKTQMKNADMTQFGFDEGAFTPGELVYAQKNPYTSFKLVPHKVINALFNNDTGEEVDSYAQVAWYWQPSVQLMNDPSNRDNLTFWPNSPKAKKEYGINTYGPDVELDFIFNFMERKKKSKDPFFIYHTSHLGHDAFDWIDPRSKSKWPGTPVIQWDGKRYTRTTPMITGENGNYDTHGTVTEPGIHRHVNYLDYQTWLYMEKVKELGIEDNTIFIFCSDNGTSGYGKNSAERQKGVHVPLIIYGPGLKKKGAQDTLVNLSDILPTIADLAGVQLPSDYEINGESLVPYLFQGKKTHRDWVYGYKGPMQIIRGEYVLRDGWGKWWDVSTTPNDLISFPQITDWSRVSPAHQAERKKLTAILPRFDRYATSHDAPHYNGPPAVLTKLPQQAITKPHVAKPQSAPPQTVVRGSTKQPDILWIITDDHRPDSLACYNKVVRGTKQSPLGYVKSQFANELAARGTLFSKAFCNSPGCAPSRASIHTGRYPFRNGIYGFEQAHDVAEFCRPTIPQVMRSAGYHTAEFGKHGYHINQWGPGPTWTVKDQYDFRIDRKNDLEAKGKTDYWASTGWANGQPVGKEEIFFLQNGSTHRYFLSRGANGPPTAEDVAARKVIDTKLDILRAHTRDSSDMIIGGQSPQPPLNTLDGEIATAFIAHLSASDRPADKPLFAHLSFHFPHTPILPPKWIRNYFKEKEEEIPWNIPAFDEEQIDLLPPQLRKLTQRMNFSNLSEEEKRQAIRDYYAFCAHGDAQIGRAINAFIANSEQASRDWIIVYTVGDHSWHLGEQGIEAKFAPWAMSTHNAIIAASSIKGLFPAGKHCDELVEFVDLAPTFYRAAGIDLQQQDYAHLDGISLTETINGKHPRDYIIGEINHVIGPRAYLRSTDFAFSMRTRQLNRKPGTGVKPGDDIRWALDCPRDKAELCLYDLRNDPDERWNVANEEAYVALADWFRTKLGNIVLGDGRIECDWQKENEYVLSHFAAGAHDRKLDIPATIIPTPAK